MAQPVKMNTHYPAERIPYTTSEAIPRNSNAKSLQKRALQALELAVHIDDMGYNIYLASEPCLGKRYLLNNFLAPYAKKKETPPDLLYVNNFENQDKPILLTLPAGLGKLFKSELAKTVQAIRKELLSRFESDSYIKKRSKLLDTFNNQKSSYIKEMNILAEKQGFSLEFEDKSSITLFPLVDGKKLSEEEFDTLDKSLQEKFKKRGDSLLKVMSNIIRKISKSEADSKESERNLDKSIMEEVLNSLLTPFATKISKPLLKHEEIKEKVKYYLDLMRNDMLDNFDIFLPKEASITGQLQDSFLSLQHEGEVYRYEVNLLVDNSSTKGAPIYYEDNPTTYNLLGCIERESEMGALITDFTLIKAGAIHKALGGYLIIHIEDILQHTQAWEGLLRTLRTKLSRIHETAEHPENTKTKCIEPQPIPLDIKIILMGPDALYESLLIHDERFAKFFKIKAQLTDSTNLTAGNIKLWLGSIAAIIDKAKLLPFNREALASLVDFSSSLCEDQHKLSLQFPLVRDIMIEASTLAKIQKKESVDESCINNALQAKRYRQSHLEELYFEEYSNEIIKIKTSGNEVGRINGLSVTMHGDHEFGLAHQISCSVGVGQGGVIDLEREAELSGPIHTKAVMILKSYLISQFAQNKPLVLTGSICFEQSYNGIEGDSASAAELCALLSALADVPIDRSLALTGALGLSGDILAVGSVTRKIEGFFALCKHRGLTGTQGVLFPYDNKNTLMLNKEVEDAVEAGKFHLYPVKHITEALPLLTHIPCGKLRKDKTFTPNSLFQKVDAKLKFFGWSAENSFKKKPRTY